MAHDLSPLELIARDRPYAPEGYEFVLRALNFLLTELSEARHVSGAELTEAIRRFALAEYGPMAKHVLNSWGIQATRDFGEIVFHLVEAGFLRKTEEDCIDDFDDCYDFAVAFEQRYYDQHAAFRP